MRKDIDVVHVSFKFCTTGCYCYFNSFLFIIMWHLLFLLSFPL